LKNYANVAQILSSREAVLHRILVFKDARFAVLRAPFPGVIFLRAFILVQ
jgi:hypothetical protein